MSDGVCHGAELSKDGRFRYSLHRLWDPGKPDAVFVMLNPSTADWTVDDPTIRRCMGFARTWRLGGIRVVNLFPLRATDPRALDAAADRAGEGNLAAIRRGADRKGINVAAWGANRLAAGDASRDVRRLFGELGIPLYCLGTTARGAPRHPLYVRADTIPVVFEPAGQALAVGQAWRGPA